MGSHRSDGMQDEDDADEQGPQTSPRIDKFAEDPHIPRSGLELPKQKFASDGNAVTPVEGDCTDVEDTGNGSIRSQTNQINDDAEEHRNPDSPQRSSCLRVDLGPDFVARNETIT